MKRLLILAVGVMAALPLLAADMNSADALKSAIAKLKAEPSYSWTVKLDFGNAGFNLEPMQGMIEKDGLMLVKQDLNGNTVQAAFKGDKVVMKLDDSWQNLDNVDQTGFNGWWLGVTKSGADEAADLASKVKELKPGADGLWSGDYTDAGATELMAFPRGKGNTNAVAPPKNAKGTVKFWVKDGELTKFESHLQGQIAFALDQDAQDWDQTRTAEFHDQGKTKVEVPAEAKAKLEAK